MVTMDVGFPTSLSTPDVGELDRNEFMRAVHTSSTHNILSGSLFNQVNCFRNRPSPFTVTFNALKSRFIHLNRRVRSLEATNGTLKADNLAAQSEICLLKDELHATRVNFYDEIELRRKDALCIQQTDKRIADLRAQVQRYGDFVSIMAKLGVDNPLYCASLSVMSKIEAEDALVDSIMEAAKEKRSPWSRIVPAVVGARSPQQYVSAISLTLQTRQDLRERTKICQFWKTTAKQDPQNSSLLTPSSSQLSDLNIDNDLNTPPNPLPTELENLLDSLKSGAIKTSRPVPHPAIDVMEEWLESELTEESLPSSSKSSQDNGQQLEPCQTSSLPSETVGILKKGDTPGRIAKLAAITQQRVRFNLNQDDDAEFSKISTGTSPSLLFDMSENADIPESTCPLSTQSGPDDTDDETASFCSTELSTSHTPITQQSTYEAPHMSPATFSADIALQEAEDASSTAEECSIVKAVGHVPQVLVRLKPPCESSLQPSLSDYCISSSGSEYSELSADCVTNETTSAQRFRQQSVSSTSACPTDAGEVPRQISPICEEPVYNGVNGTSELRESTVGHTKTKPAPMWRPKTPEMISRVDDYPLIDDEPGHCERYSSPNPKTPLRTKATSSRAPFPFPSSPAKASRPPTQTKDVTCITSGLRSPTRRNIAPVTSKSTPPKKSSVVFELGSDPVRRNGPPPVSQDMNSCSTSPSQSQRATLKRPSPSKLAVPQISYGKRATLQSLDVNAPIVRHARKPSDLASNGRDEADSSRSKLAKAPPPSKDLSKRRGVIMMENLNIESNVNEVTPKAVRGSTIVPNISGMDISEPPTLIPSAASESVGIATMVTASATLKIGFDATYDDVSAPASQLDGTCSRLQCSEQNTSLHSSSYESEISELVAAMSNSDLGSLEMTDESDSETSGPAAPRRSTLDALPRVCKDIMNAPSDASRNGRSGGNGQSSRISHGAIPIVSSSHLFSRLHPPKLISATFGSIPSSESMPTSSSTSSSSSSALFDSPTRSKSIISPFTRLGLGHRTTRSGSSFVPTKMATPASAVKYAMPTVTSLPRASHPSRVLQAVPAKSVIPSPQSRRPLGKPTPSYESTSKGKQREQEQDFTLTPVSKVAKKTSKLPSPAESTFGLSKQQNGTTDPSPTREPKAWMGQSIFGRFTKSSLSSTTPQAFGKTSKPPLSPNGSTVSPAKPRSHTINTVAPSLQQQSSRSAQTLEFPSPSTKPRSNTVNTYSPVTRSPLSQHVTNSSVDSQFRSSVPTTTTQAALPAPSTYSTKSKSVTPPKIAQPTGKSTAPLRYINKPGTHSTAQKAGPVPPTAAFMIQSKPVVRTGRRVDSSVTPLIPSSANGVISPSQCRSLLRNTLSLAVR